MKKTSSSNTRKDAAANKRVLAAARSAVRKAIKAHKAEGVPIVVWQNGKIVRVPAAKIAI